MMPIADRDILFANAEMEFADLKETNQKKVGGTVTRARQCDAKDFDNNI